MTANERWFQRNPKKTIALVILLFVLCIDGLVGLILIPRNFDAFRVPHPYFHHGLKANWHEQAQWGGELYPMYTNSLGFRDNSSRTIQPQTTQKRTLLIGDSFTEGIGLPYPQTFAGLLQKELKKQNIELLNAAVVSYSPKLYYLKIKYLLEKQKLSFDRLLVFIDISDIQNEISYRDFSPQPFNFWPMTLYYSKRFLKGHSFLYYSINRLLTSREDALTAGAVQDGIFPCFAETDKKMLRDQVFQDTCARWTIDQKVFKAYGQTGLSLAIQNMQKLVDLCKQHRITLLIAVYPWPDQIFYRDLDSIQVKAWQQFAFQNSITLIDLFPAFITEQRARDVYAQYFLPRDVHWNARGHQLVAQKVLPFLQ